MDFKPYFFGLSVADREDFAKKVGSTRGMLTQVAYRNKSVELGFADVLVAATGRQVSLDDLPLTANAAQQRRAREGRAFVPHATAA